MLLLLQVYIKEIASWTKVLYKRVRFRIPGGGGEEKGSLDFFKPYFRNND